MPIQERHKKHNNRAKNWRNNKKKVTDFKFESLKHEWSEKQKILKFNWKKVSKNTSKHNKAKIKYTFVRVCVNYKTYESTNKSFLRFLYCKPLYLVPTQKSMLDVVVYFRNTTVCKRDYNTFYAFSLINTMKNCTNLRVTKNYAFCACRN